MNRPELERRTGAPVPAAQMRHARAAATSLVFTVTVGEEIFGEEIFGKEIFGLPIEHVRTVFRVAEITPVPLAPPHIVGLINLRGKILTAVCLRRRLGLPPHTQDRPFAVCLKYAGEDFALIADAVHDVVELREADRLPSLAHITDARAQLTQSIYRRGEHLLPVLDIAKTVLTSRTAQAA